MFEPDAGWVSLVAALAAVAGRTYLGRYSMDERQRKAAVEEVRDALWHHRDIIAEHLIGHLERPHTCGIPAQLLLVGWDWQAFIVAAGFDARDLLDG